MGCRCNERGDQLKRAGQLVAKGQVSDAVKQLGQTAQSFVQDARSAQTRREMLAKLRAIGR